MSEYAYTAAPWHIQRNDWGTPIAIRNQHKELVAIDLKFRCGCEAEANMSLIAAAPDMLKALRKAEAILEDVVASSLFPPDDPSDRVALDAVQDAIAKAKGSVS